MGLSQNELSKRLHIHEKTVRNWESHHTKPLATSVSKIIMFLGYDPLAEEIQPPVQRGDPVMG
jgi:DNA-binding transcriptional regulator YiaG